MAKAKSIFIVIIVVLFILINVSCSGDSNSPSKSSTLSNTALIDIITPTPYIASTITSDSPILSNTATTVIITSTPSIAPTPEYIKSDLYSYKIKETVTTPENVTYVVFSFIRPIFEESSALAKEINKFYDAEETKYKNSFDEIIRENDHPYGGSSAKLYTRTCEKAFESNRIVSFTSSENWYMGGVWRRETLGQTYDFTLGRELKFRDIFYENETQIVNLLIEICSDYRGDMSDPEFAEYVAVYDWLYLASSANFYLAEDGIHFFYKFSYTDLNSGYDMLIPWSRTDVIRPEYLN